MKWVRVLSKYKYQWVVSTKWWGVRSIVYNVLKQQSMLQDIGKHVEINKQYVSLWVAFNQNKKEGRES